MKFQLKGVILNIREFSMKVRPIIAQHLYQQMPFDRADTSAAEVRVVEEWIIKKLIDDLTGVNINNYSRRDSNYESIFYAVRRAYSEYGVPMEVEFLRALTEAIPLHLIPDSVVIDYQYDCLILKNGQDSNWLVKL